MKEKKKDYLKNICFRLKVWNVVHSMVVLEILVFTLFQWDFFFTGSKVPPPIHTIFLLKTDIDWKYEGCWVSFSYSASFISSFFVFLSWKMVFYNIYFFLVGLGATISKNPSRKCYLDFCRFHLVLLLIFSHKGHPEKM